MTETNVNIIKSNADTKQNNNLTDTSQENSDIKNDILKYENLIKLPSTLSRIYDPTDQNIKICADFLKGGGIVGMPTETVYGLAANALNVDACFKIFEYKGRPLTDPLIVHVNSIKMAKSISKMNKKTEELFDFLSREFWPGPLTMIVEADLNLISTKILANHTTVGLRFPSNVYAQKLIEFSGVPIAAPSANKFCHISPVNPYHVFEDFKEFDVKIINGGITNFCMESTVIKFEFIDDGKNESNKICVNKPYCKIIVLRLGAISHKQIQESLQNSKTPKFSSIRVEPLTKNKPENVKNLIEKQEKLKENSALIGNLITINKDAPGQFLRHYSPKIETFIYDEDEFYSEKKLEPEIIFIDFKGQLREKFGEKIRDFYVGKYTGSSGDEKGDKNSGLNFDLKNYFIELSAKGDPYEAQQNLYNALHIAENMSNKQCVVILNLEKYMEENAFKLTILDRMWKASSFKKINIKC